MRWLGGVVLTLMLLVGNMAPVWATAVSELPATPPQWVLDQGEVFSPSTVNQVNRTLTQLNKDTGGAGAVGQPAAAGLRGNRHQFRGKALPTLVSRWGCQAGVNHARYPHSHC